MTWQVYILECRNGSLYTGMTNDLSARLEKHKQGKGGHYTRAFGVKRLRYQEVCASRSEALRREAEIKGLSRKEKMTIIRLSVKKI